MAVEVELIGALEEINNLKKKNNRPSKEIIFIKTKREEEKILEEIFNNQLKQKEENCEKLEAGIVSLRK